VRLNACPSEGKNAIPTLSRRDCELLAAGDWSELSHKFDYSGTNRDKNDRRQNKDYQWGNHLDRGFCCLLFGALPAFRAEGVGMHPEGLGHACAEAICLYECTNQGSNIVNTRAVDEIPEGFSAGLACSHLQVYEMEFIAEIRVSVMKILAHAHERLVEC